MADEDLRRLEREATANDPAACMRYAGALEREGRRAEAARALRRAIDSEAAREVLAGYPAWAHPWATAGRARSLDVEPVVARPRVLWTAKVDHGPGLSSSQTAWSSHRLLASPLGVVCATDRGVVVLDPDSGAERWHRNWAKRALAGGSPWRPQLEIHGQTLLVWNGDALWRNDLATGKAHGELRAPWATQALLDRGLLVAVEEDAIVARSVGREAQGEELWRAPRPRGELVLAAAEDQVFIWSQGVIAAHDRSSGEERWQEFGSATFLADREGLVTLAEDPPRLELRDAKGQPVRRIEEGTWAFALTRDLVVVGVGGAQAVAVVERASGAQTMLPALRAAGAPIVARDVIYGATDEACSRLGACRASGEQLWGLDLPRPTGRGARSERSGVAALALLDRMVFAIVGETTLVALTDL